MGNWLQGLIPMLCVMALIFAVVVGLTVAAAFLWGWWAVLVPVGAVALLYGFYGLIVGWD